MMLLNTRFLPNFTFLIKVVVKMLGLAENMVNSRLLIFALAGKKSSRQNICKVVVLNKCPCLSLKKKAPRLVTKEIIQ